MGLFDNIFNAGNNIAKNVTSAIGNKSETFTFQRLPESVGELMALPEATLDTPFKTAALTVCALCAYAASPQIGQEMLNFLKGPAPLNQVEISFLRDRFRDSGTYVPFSYFAGATPDNNYTPNVPFSVTVTSNQYSKRDDTHVTLWLRSGGADNPREVALRLKPSEGTWYLNEQHLLVMVSTPQAQRAGAS